MAARNTIAFVLLLLGLGAPRLARACATCGCGDETLTATGVERPYRNRVRLALDERYGSLSTGTSASRENVWFLRTTLSVAWSPLRRLTLGLQLPWVTDWIDRTGLTRRTLNGLGDLELSARGVVYQDRGFLPHHLLWVGGGLKLPTGWRVYDATGYPFSDDDQPSTGSFDPFAGVTYAWFGGGIVSVFASTSFRYATPGWRGYTRGSVLGVSAAVQLQPHPRVAVQLGVDGSWVQSDTLANGAASPDTGGTVAYVAPALLVNPYRDLLLRLVVDAPVLFVPNGHQSIGTQVGLTVSYDVH